MSIVAEKISLALKVNHKCTMQKSKEVLILKCGVSKKSSEWVSKWELEAFSTVTNNANFSTKNSKLLPRTGSQSFLAPTQTSTLPWFSAQVSKQHKMLLFPWCAVPRLLKSHTSSHFCVQVVLLYASTYVLVSLSIDRYHAIVHPMKFLQGGELAQPSVIS